MYYDDRVDKKQGKDSDDDDDDDDGFGLTTLACRILVP